MYFEKTTLPGSAPHPGSDGRPMCEGREWQQRGRAATNSSIISPTNGIWARCGNKVDSLMPKQCHLSPEICRIPVGVLVEASSPSQVASPAEFAHPASLQQDSAVIGISLDRRCVRQCAGNIQRKCIEYFRPSFNTSRQKQ